MLLLGIATAIFALLSCRNNDGPHKSNSGISHLADSDELVLRLMVWEGYAPQTILDDFEAEMENMYDLPIRLEVYFIECHDDLFDPVRAGEVDVISISHHIFKDERFNYIEKGLLIPSDLNNIPDYSRIMPEIQKADYHLSDGIVYGIPVANGPYGLTYNTELVSQAPQSWEVLWDPGYKDRFAIGGAEYLYNIRITALALGYPRESISDYDNLVMCKILGLVIIIGCNNYAK